MLQVLEGARAIGDGGNYLVSVTNIFVPSLVLLSFSNHCLRLPRKMKIVFVYCFFGQNKIRCDFIFLETAVSSKPRALYFCGEI